MVIKAYESFLLSNASQITAVESTLRSLTYFLPGRFKDAELAGEAIYSAMNLLGLYHDEILKRLVIYRDITIDSPQQARNQVQSFSSPGGSDGTFDHPLLPHTPSSHARYTNYYSEQSSVYKTAARLLVIIGYTELLAEMVARRKLSRRRAWDAVLAIETLKASLRITLFHITSSRLSINPPIPEREVDPAMLESEREEALLARLREASATAAQASSVSNDQQRKLPIGDFSGTSKVPGVKSDTWVGSRTGFIRPTLASLRKDDRPIDPVTGRRIPDSPDTVSRASGSRLTSRSRSRSRLSSQSDEDDDSDSSDETLVEHGSGATPTTPLTQQSIETYLTSRALTKEDVVPPPALVRSFVGSKRGILAEYLWILRPILYLLAIRKWGAKRWEPWTLSLVVESASHLLRGSAYKSGTLNGSMDGVGSPMAPLQMLLTILSSTSNPLFRLVAHLGRSTLATSQPISQVEGEEWSRRKRAFLWYLLRGPLWETWTKKKVVAICDRWEDRALLGLGASMAKEYVPLVDELWFYTASQ